MGLFTSTRNGDHIRLCHEIGWPVDHRKGNVIGLDFGGDGTPQRTLFVIHSPGERVMGFSIDCRAEFSSHNLPDDLLGAMLAHNENVTFGGWQARLEERTIGLRLRYTALADGMDAAMFKTICTELVKEVAQIEANLQRKGLL